MKKLLRFLIFLIALYGYSQDCPDLINPSNGQVNVPVDATITWEAVDGVPGYRVRIGTGPGLGDIAQATVGTATSFTPILGLPENTEIFVTVILDFSFSGGSTIECDSQSFTTEDVTVPPACTQMQIPANGATDVSVFTNIYSTAIANNAASNQLLICPTTDKSTVRAR